MMISDRIAPVVWEILLHTLHSFKTQPQPKNSDDKVVLLTSPWISDIKNRSYKLNLPLQETVSCVVGRDLKSLQTILIELSKAGAKVRLLTTSPDSNWKKDKASGYKRKEKILLDNLNRNGVSIRFNDDNHSKSISTPLAVISGSANATDNGFYRFTEAVSLTTRGQPDFKQDRDVCSGIWGRGYLRVN